MAFTAIIENVVPFLLLLFAGAAGMSFEDVAASAGVRFVHEHEPTAAKRQIETMPGGLAVFDYDGDGRLDIYFTNGAKGRNRLFRTLGEMKFEDVTAKAGAPGAAYSFGVAAADYDNDGDIDLFIAGVGQNVLYRNRGDGTFEDVTARAGLRGGVWAVAAGWFDYDNDGRLDLFVVNYAKWDPKTEPYCGDRGRGIRVYCHPRLYEGLPNALYRNRGDGSFEDVSASTGIGKHIGRGMSAAFADADADGYLDVIVPNDKLPNFLFRNRGGKTFEEDALLGGAALLDHGKPVSGMGVDFRDADNDGAPDVVMTALNNETFPFFRNDGTGVFRDATFSSKLGPISSGFSGWGVALADLDNDGRKDIFSANSHVNDRIEAFESAKYRQENTIFRGTAAGYELALTLPGARVHRGSAIADLDGDGRLDVVVSALGDPAEVWRNTTQGAGHWLLIKLEGSKSNRDGIGARVRIGTQHNHMTTAVGYASSVHAGVPFGLGAAKTVPEVEVRWPSGVVQVLRDVAADQVVTVREADAEGATGR